MNAITLHAIGLARCGSWKLLDALEVRERAHREPTSAGMAHAPGSVALLGYLGAPRHDAGVGTVPCPECEGDGEIEITGATGRTRYSDCPWCDGEGEADADAMDRSDTYTHASECRRWASLNGDPVEVNVDAIGTGCWMSIAEATRVIAEYTGLVSKLANTAQAVQP